MKNYHISVNEFAKFSVATDKGKIRILEQQIIPNPVLIPWYQSAKGSIKRYLKDVNDYEPLMEGIKKVSLKKPQNQRQISDKTISIEALRRLINLKLSKHFKGLEYETIKPNIKTVTIRNIEIGITPELIFKTKIKGEIVYGGVKIHISKNKPFSLNQCQHVSTMLMRYIKKNIAKSGETVSPSLCLCIDIFGERIVPAKDDEKTINEIRTLCEEIKTNWPE